jgi:two-component system sensor histidine kinase SenX3
MVTIEDITEQARLDQVRTDFVANVSHELKTPVGAISVLAETLEGETQDELVLRLSGRMVSECERMARTIDDLLELSRIEMGGEMLVAPVKLHDVVREAVERAQLLAEHKNIALKVDEKADAIVQGDFYQLVSAVGNLVDNAVKYSDEGSSVEIQITSNAQNANIAVQDHGVGIPADGIERIFERFYRVDRARSRGTGGTGLGLSIVRHVATNHEGDVSVSSREGEGSTFVLRLPVRSE